MARGAYESVLPVVRVVGWTKSRGHPYGVTRFAQLSFVGLRELERRLADRSLGIQALRVLMAMIENSDYENFVRAGQKDLARQLDMAQAHVSKAVVRLCEVGFVERTNDRGRYVISPRLCWKGDAASLRRALADRGMLGSNGLMCERQAA